MRIVKLEAENFKILRAIEITPTGNIVTIGGKNGHGKSSVLDAVWVALAGRSVAPPKPIRKGEEQCRIRLDLGELIITRTFSQKEDGKITDTVKVESADGKQRYTSPQGMLDDLLGQIGFDPFEFVQMEPKTQAATLLQMVPLPIDLEEFARMDAADYEERRDINRDGVALKGQLDGIAVIPDLPEEPIDRDAILEQLSSAAETNSAIDRDRMAREERRRDALRAREGADQQEGSAGEMRKEAARLTAQADDFEDSAKGHRERAADIDKEVEALPALADPVDTAKLREELASAEETNRKIERMAERAALSARIDAMRVESQGYTDAMALRAKQRADALTKAKMPIDGLGFSTDEKGKPIVTYGGVPFEQASSGEQLQASTAIAMAGNPELRVLRIKDGSLLDEDSMAMLDKMATEGDFQLWIEVVGTGGVGIIMEDGMIKGAPVREPEPDKPKAKPKAKAADKPEGAML